MGIGMGALIAGLFGMNVCLPFSLSSPALTSILVNKSHRSNPLRLCRHVCSIYSCSCSSIMDWSQKVPCFCLYRRTAHVNDSFQASEDTESWSLRI